MLQAKHATPNNWYTGKKTYFCTLMRKSLSIIAIFTIALTLTSCKSEFERIRASTNAPLMLEKAYSYYENEDWDKGQILFESALNYYRARQEAEKLYFHYAYTFYHMKQYSLAGNYFKNFANTFTNSPYREEALFMVAFSEYNQSPSYRLDQTHTYTAINGFELFANTYPNSEKVADCNRLIDELRNKLEKKAFYQAQLYFDLKDYRASVISFENLLQDFPETKQADKVRYMITNAAYSLADLSIYEKQAERFRETINYANIFLEKFPESEYKNEVLRLQQQAEAQLKQFEQ